MIERKGDLVRRNIWSTVHEFVKAQHSIEKSAAGRRLHIWNDNDEQRFKVWEDKMKLLHAVAKQNRAPVRDKDADHFYKHKMTSSMWKIELHVMPNGEVHMINREVASSVKII